MWEDIFRSDRAELAPKIGERFKLRELTKNAKVEYEGLAMKKHKATITFPSSQQPCQCSKHRGNSYVYHLLPNNPVF